MILMESCRRPWTPTADLSLPPGQPSDYIILPGDDHHSTVSQSTIQRFVTDLLGGFVLSWFACLDLVGVWQHLTCQTGREARASVSGWVRQATDCSTDPAFVQAIGPTSRRTLRNLLPTCISNPHGYRCPSSEPTSPDRLSPSESHHLPLK